MTHLDPRAETAALAVAEAAAWIFHHEEPIEDFAEYLPALCSDEEWLRICHRLATALEDQETVADFAASLGMTSGVTGYAYHTIPVALYAWLRHRNDFGSALAGAIRCGGDTDTVATIAGALAGCDAGVKGIPKGWRNGLVDWPRSPLLLQRLAEELAADDGKPVRWFWPGVIPRNLFFLVVVLFHGFRRLLPPY
jgi:ADP-ribosyl-[dinitrogen reductase] hydrolase